jgi:opacity protein-like surface antigen
MLRKGIFLLPLLAVFFPSATAHTQSGASGYNNPGFELYGGYSYIFRPYDSTSQTPISGGMNGWDSSLRVPLPFMPQWLGVKGDVSGGYRSDGSLDLNPHAYFFLLGPQITAHIANSTLWVHGLAGSAHLNNAALPSLTSNSTFALALGGGVDFGLAHRLAWRVSLDYYNTHFHSSDNAVSQIANSNGRVSTGPVFRF